MAFKIGMRLATGSGKQTSTNETLHNTFSLKPISLDRAYVELAPASHIRLVGGQAKNPFYSTDLVWDTDVNPEGVSISSQLSSDRVDLLFALGIFPIDEYKSSSEDPILYGLQGGFATNAIGENFRVGLAYYDFTNLKGKSIEDVSPGYVKKTNTLRKKDDKHYFVHLYQVIDVNVELTPFGFSIYRRSLPLRFYKNYARNVAGEVEEHRGWLVGFKVGSMQRAGNIQFTYNYRKIKKDVLAAIINDSDFHGGGTNGKGHKVSCKIGFWQIASFGCTYFLTEGVTGGADEHNTLQVDFASRF